MGNVVAASKTLSSVAAFRSSAEESSNASGRSSIAAMLEKDVPIHSSAVRNALACLNARTLTAVSVARRALEV